MDPWRWTLYEGKLCHIEQEGEWKNHPEINRPKDAYIDLPLIAAPSLNVSMAKGSINTCSAVMPSFTIPS